MGVGVSVYVQRSSRSLVCMELKAVWCCVVARLELLIILCECDEWHGESQTHRSATLDPSIMT